MTTERFRKSNDILFAATPSVTNNWLPVRCLRAQSCPDWDLFASRAIIELSSKISWLWATTMCFSFFWALPSVKKTQPQRQVQLSYNHRINQLTDLKEMDAVGCSLSFLSATCSPVPTVTFLWVHTLLAGTWLVSDWDDQWEEGVKPVSPLCAHQDALMFFWVKMGDSVLLLLLLLGPKEAEDHMTGWPCFLLPYE